LRDSPVTIARPAGDNRARGPFPLEEFAPVLQLFARARVLGTSTNHPT
jgi:hypothetical protein